MLAHCSPAARGCGPEPPQTSTCLELAQKEAQHAAHICRALQTLHTPRNSACPTAQQRLALSLLRMRRSTRPTRSLVKGCVHGGSANSACIVECAR